MEDNEDLRLYRFFRWFQLHGEKHVDKSIEHMIQIYLNERNNKCNN